MKKSLILSSLFAFAAMTSCQKQTGSEIEEETSSTAKAYLSIQVESSASTKADDGSTVAGEGDENTVSSVTLYTFD